MEFVFVLVAVGGLPLSLLVAAFVAIETPWLIERNTRERKLLLAMLSDLADEAHGWKRDGRVYTHIDSGVTFRKVSSFMTSADFQLTHPAEISFGADTKGGRILSRVVKAVAASEGRADDLEAIAAMNDAYRRMNGLPH
jgi:hypothetical protein